MVWCAVRCMYVLKLKIIRLYILKSKYEYDSRIKSEGVAEEPQKLFQDVYYYPK
jgi:hypothetical protein